MVIKSRDQVNSLEKLKGRIVSKGELNLYEGILQEKITLIEKQIESTKLELAAIEGMLVLLDDYEDSKPKVVEQARYQSFGIGQAGFSINTGFNFNPQS